MNTPPDAAEHPGPSSQEEWPGWAVPGPYSDPAVCRAKFDREIASFQASSPTYRKDGVLLVHADYPAVTLAFAAPQLRPVPVVFGIEVDFTNYDAWPLSVRFVNPFTGVRLVGMDLPPRQPNGLWTSRLLAPPEQTPEGLNLSASAPLVQGEPDDWPFLCLPGTREYHQNPFHSNDPWFAHRGRGEGTLQHLVDQLVANGTEPLRGFSPHFRLEQSGPSSASVHVVDFQLVVGISALPSS